MSEQDIIAQSLGYQNYGNYRARALWKKIRARILERDKSLCRCCGGKAEVVHHRTYALEVLTGDDDEQLVAVCHGCHDYIHYKDPNPERPLNRRERRTTAETDALLLAGRQDASFPAPKYDLRREHCGPKYPDGWKRWSSLQQDGWQHEYDRQGCLRRLRKYADSPWWVKYLSQQLREVHGMDDAKIDHLVSKARETLQKRKAQKRKPSTRTPTRDSTRN